MTPVKFEGEPPFSLPLAQSASATAQDETVEMVLRVSVDGRLTSVRVPMLEKIADDLAIHLTRAAIQARSNAKRD